MRTSKLLLISTFFLLLRIESNAGSTNIKDTAIYRYSRSSLKDTFNKLTQPKIYILNKTTPSKFKDLLPFLTLLLGIFLNRFLDVYYDLRKYFKAGKRWKAEYISLRSPVKIMCENINDFLQNHNKETLEYPILTVPDSLSCSNFDTFSSSELIDYYQDFLDKNYSDSIKCNNKGTTFISIMKFHYKTLTSRFESYLEGLSKCTTNFNRDLQDLHIAILNYGIEIETETQAAPILNPHYKNINQLYFDHIAGQTSLNPFVLENTFFKPLVQELGHLRLDKRSTQTRDIAFKCLNDIKYIRLEKEYLTINLTTIKERYLKELDELNEVINFFNPNTMANCRFGIRRGVAFLIKSGF